MYQCKISCCFKNHTFGAPSSCKRWSIISSLSRRAWNMAGPFTKSLFWALNLEMEMLLENTIGQAAYSWCMCMHAVIGCWMTTTSLPLLPKAMPGWPTSIAGSKGQPGGPMESKVEKLNGARYFYQFHIINTSCFNCFFLVWCVRF